MDVASWRRRPHGLVRGLDAEGDPVIETLTQAASRIGVSRITLWRAVRSRELGAAPLAARGRLVLGVESEAVDRWGAARCARRACTRIAPADARELVYQHCLGAELAKRGLKP